VSGSEVASQYVSGGVVESRCMSGSEAESQYVSGSEVEYRCVSGSEAESQYYCFVLKMKKA
jgi:hypothetical protein